MTSLQNVENKGGGRTVNSSPCPDPTEQIKSIGSVIGTVSGAIGLFTLIKKGWNNYREKHPTFKKTVIDSLEQIKKGQKRFEDFNAATLRERLGSIHNLYVKQMRWCSRDQKEKIVPLFDIYMENYAAFSDRPLILKDKQEIIDLPESKEERQALEEQQKELQKEKEN